MAGHTLIDLNSNECNQRFFYYPFMVNFNKCNGCCNNPDGTSGKIYVPNKTEDISLSVFNMITRRNESKMLIKQIFYANVNANLMAEKVV